MSVEIRKMKNHRASGEDSIVAELIKYGGFVLEKYLHEIIEEVYSKDI